jgi:hypothetical protein
MLLLLLAFISYCGYGRDQKLLNMSAKQESLMALCSIAQCILLGSFAAILGAHRSEILDKPRSESPYDADAYEAPALTGSSA